MPTEIQVSILSYFSLNFARQLQWWDKSIMLYKEIWTPITHSFQARFPISWTVEVLTGSWNRAFERDIFPHLSLLSGYISTKLETVSFLLSFSLRISAEREGTRFVVNTEGTHYSSHIDSSGYVPVSLFVPFPDDAFITRLKLVCILLVLRLLSYTLSFHTLFISLLVSADSPCLLLSLLFFGLYCVFYPDSIRGRERRKNKEQRITLWRRQEITVKNKGRRESKRKSLQ